jgi:hypothetical protein
MVLRASAWMAAAWMALLVSVPSLAHAQTCAGGVRLLGDVSAVTALAAALAPRGLHVAEEGGCAEVTIEVDRVGERYRITLVSGGEDEMRELDRIETAALLVESWAAAAEVDLLEPVAGEVGSESESARESGSGGEGEGAGESESESESGLAASEPGAAHARGMGAATVFALGELALGADGSTWFGARLGACANIGPFCLGGSVRYLADTGLSEATLGEGESRAYLGGDVDFALPFAPTDALRVVPAVMVGVGWMHITSVEAGRTATSDEARARLGVALSGAVRIVDWLFLELAASFAWSPLAHTAPWIADSIPIDPDPPFYGSAQLGLRAEVP